MSNQEYQKVINLFRVHQKRIGFVGTVYRSPVTLEQIYSLIEISISPTISIGELSDRLMLPRNSISRAIATLEQKQFIESKVNAADQRRRVFKILRKGGDFLESHERKSRQFVEEHLAYLSNAEIIELQQFQNRICEALNVAPVTIRPSEHPFQKGMRRVTRAFGFVGNSLFESGYSSTEWHILSAIFYASTAPTLSTLADELGLLPTTLTQILTRLESLKLVQRTPSKADRRVKLLTLSKKGELVLNEIENCGHSKLKKSFHSSQIEELKRFSYILGKHLNVTAAQEALYLRGALEVQELTTESDLVLARAFTVYHLVACGWHQNLSPQLLSATNRIFALQENTETLAIIEIIDRAPTLRSNLFAYREGAIESTILAQFILQALLKVVAKRTENSMHMLTRTIPAKCYDLLSVKQIDDDWSELAILA